MLMSKLTKATMASAAILVGSFAAASTPQAGPIAPHIQLAPIATPLATRDIDASIHQVRRGRRSGRRFRAGRRSRFGRHRRGFRRFNRFGRYRGYRRPSYGYRSYSRRRHHPGYFFGRHSDFR